MIDGAVMDRNMPTDMVYTIFSNDKEYHHLFGSFYPNQEAGPIPSVTILRMNLKIDCN
jgi:hypothetical protein